MGSALRAHEERAALLRRHAEHARVRQANQEASRWDELAAEHDQHVESIRQLVMRELQAAEPAPGAPEPARAVRFSTGSAAAPSC
ncbi:MAG TPA: hypothetical protein VFY19_00070 [Geminicoccaceae bacterium]|nr:hypothetical protein [Geminicoccaceae bacterium]